jgi:hypothetical protein
VVKSSKILMLYWLVFLVVVEPSRWCTDIECKIDTACNQVERRPVSANVFASLEKGKPSTTMPPPELLLFSEFVGRKGKVPILSG